MKFIHQLLLITALLAPFPSLRADDSVTTSDVVLMAEEAGNIGIDDSALADYADSLCFAVPIVLNGADWTPIATALANTDRSVANIVHIGDSHLQADWPTAHLRRAFQECYGDAGRGLVTPFRLSGTYQPDDYTISSTTSWTASRLLRYPWNPPMSFAGTALRADSDSADITVSIDTGVFNSIRIFHAGSFEITSVTSGGIDIDYDINCLDRDATEIILPDIFSSATIRFAPAADFVLHAMELTGGDPGVAYHTIGNGGSDMNMYNLIGNFGAGVAKLSPNLIILALGTNDSYNNFSADRFRRNLDRLVTDLRRNNPGVPLLLVTPMEIQRSTSSTKRVKGKNGRWRTVRGKNKVHCVVEGCAQIHDIMLDYGRRNNIAVYDWYAATGGAGASQRWVDAGLMRADHIHLTVAGYRRHAQMLYSALSDAIANQK